MKEDPELFPQWLRTLQCGFSVLVEGCGSKRRLLEDFADKVLMPWCGAVVKMEAFSACFPTAECLRGILDRLHPGFPRTSRTVPALCTALCAARKAAKTPLRPLCLVVHNIEALPQVHQTALASLAACAPRLHIVASVDSTWAPLGWTPRVALDFMFCRMQVHTHESYTVEGAARFVGGLPAWADPNADRRRAPKARVSIVLRSVTNNHRELVQAMAERQLELGGRIGVSKSALLTIATDRMIATHAAKLKSLLTELKDHEVVCERVGADGSMLYHLPYDNQMLQRLADGTALDDSDDEGDGDNDAGDAIDDDAQLPSGSVGTSAA